VNDAERSVLHAAAVSCIEEEVLILSYPRYCRYRAAICRLTADLQTSDSSPSASSFLDALSPRLLAAVGLTADLPLTPYLQSTGVQSSGYPHTGVPGTGVPRVLFCRSTVVHPALQKHAFRLDELGTLRNY